MKSKRLQTVVNKFLNVEQSTEEVTQENTTRKTKSARGKGKAKEKNNPDVDIDLKDEMIDGIGESKTNAKNNKSKAPAKGKRGKGKTKTDEDEGLKEEIDNSAPSVTKNKSQKGKGSTKNSKGKSTTKNCTIDIDENVEEVSRYFDSEQLSVKGKTNKNSNAGRGKGRGNRTKTPEDSNLLGTEVTIDSDESSDSGTSDSASDSHSDSDISGSDDNQVTQSSLSVAEILGLKIGDSKFENAAKKNKSIAGPSGVSKQMKVFESGLNVVEIMKLQSGEKEQETNTETDQCYSDSEMDVEKNNEGADTDKIGQSDSEDSEFYKNEGGFIREDGDVMVRENYTAKIKGSKDNTMMNKCTNKTLQEVTKHTSHEEGSEIIASSPKVVAEANSKPTSDKHSDWGKAKSIAIQQQELVTESEMSESSWTNKEDMTRSRTKETEESKRVTRGRKHQDNKIKGKKNDVQVYENKDRHELNTENKNKMEQVSKIDVKSEKKIEELSIKTIELEEKHAKNKDKSIDKKKDTLEIVKKDNKGIKRNARDKESGELKEDVEHINLEQSTEPIKRIVSGVPWADQGKKRGRKGKTGGAVGGLKRNMEPVERLEKKGKAVKASARFPVGCVNLSESDSDSSS